MPWPAERRRVSVLLGVLSIAAASLASVISATGAQEERRYVAPGAQIPAASPKMAEASIRAMVLDREWQCQKKNGAWEKAFRLKLTSNKQEALTPTGPILPNAGNPALFDAAMTSRNSDIYSKFGFLEISAALITLKWYAAWHEDPTATRATARAFRGVNQYPGEVQIDAAIIDNLERGIIMVDAKSDNFLGDSVEIEVDAIERAHFSGRIRGIRPPSRAQTDNQVLEYDPVSGRIRNIQSPNSSTVGFDAYAYKPIRCDQVIAKK